MTEDIVRQTMYCHGCRKDFTVELDLSLSGNHVINCPHCDHEHCRVVQDGKVTSDRWDRRNGNNGAVFVATTFTSTTSSTATSTFLTDAWSNTTTAGTWFTTTGTAT